tara:strand:- start:28 stop:138 length:111 start_codon:yes stop_codon:yes gene_type:complete
MNLARLSRVFAGIEPIDYVRILRPLDASPRRSRRAR